MLICSIIPKVMHMNLSKTLILSTFQDRTIEWRFQHLGQYSKNIYSHTKIIWREGLKKGTIEHITPSPLIL